MKGSSLKETRKRTKTSFPKMLLKLSFRQSLSRNPGFPVKTGIQFLNLDTCLRRYDIKGIFMFFWLSLSIFLSSYAYAGVLGPGWFMGTAEPVSPEEADVYYNSQQLAPEGVSARSAQGGVTALTAASATTASSEIIELARALQYDPKLIYDYIHNHIDYVPYFGSLKGAALTYLDGSGNDFDQASLFITLLRESANYNSSIGTVQYIYGKMTIPGDQLANWLGVDQNRDVINAVISSGGIPITNGYPLSDGTTKFKRVWVKANINGVDYLFDPAFKSYQYTGKIDIGNAAGYNRDELLAAAQSGATVGADYVQNLNEGNIGSKLTQYSSNLINTIKGQYPNSDMKDIIGGRSIIQTNLINYQTALPFSPTVSAPWDEIPSSNTATLRIWHVNYGIDYVFQTPDLAGKRLTLTYLNNRPQLLLDGVLVDSGSLTTPGSPYELQIIMKHPYPADNGNYGDQTASYTVKSGSSYAIVYNFGGVSDMLLQKRQEQLDAYLAQGLAQTSEAVLGETLNIMGLTWLKELQMTDSLLSSLADTVSINHHRIGLMAQETGYYIDVRNSFSSIISKHNIDADRQAHFKTVSLIGSAFEHGMLEQMMGSSNQAASTMKLFKIANSNPSNNKVFSINNSNFDILTPQLVNYDPNEINDNNPNTHSDFRTIIDDGYDLIVPQDGRLFLNSWRGKGYIAKQFYPDGGMSMEMAIGGGYFGGYNSTTGNVNTTTVANNNTVNQANNSTPATTYPQVSLLPTKLSEEPVDMAGGAYIYDSTDLSLGNNAPLGLSFSRSYNSNQNLKKKTLGYGWTHNYDIYLERHSHGEPGLGRRQPVDAAALIASVYANLDLLKTQDDILGWMTASLTSKWAVDQVIYNVSQSIDNAVTVHLGSKVMEFIKLSDGTYAAPPGITTQLIKNVDGTYSLKERFGSQIDFNTSNKIFQLKDVDNNPMTFTYTGDNLTTVRDAFNRTLTLTYTSGKLTSVSDSAGRSVSYSYTNDDLTTYHDPENKAWGYGYTDTNNPHRMTSLTNPLTITTATNTYDSLGRVKTQTVPRQTGNATYNFYFSGFRNAEQDPDSKTNVYYYDDKGRPIAEENQLGYKTSKEYDGQFHIIKTTDARPAHYETNFLYDGNQNMIRAINALTQSIDYVYDLQFHLTDTVDPLFHGSHFEYDPEHHPTLSKYGVQYDTNYLPIDNGKFQTGASYYANGFPQTTTDGRSTQTTLVYDSYGNPYTTKVAAHPVLTTVYNSKGWLTSLTDQVNTITNFPIYNNRGQLKKKTDPLLKDTIFEYDNAGRLDYVIDRNNNMIDYSYTPTSKLDTITYPDTSTVHFTYNQHDDLTGMQDNVGSTSYGHDFAHRLTSSTFTYTYNPASFTVAYSQYDENGNLTELTYPGNKKVIYTYDELNRLKTVKIDWLNQTATYNYDDAGRLTSLTNFNGTVTTYGYDNANRLTDLMNKKSDTTILSSYSFILDGNSNRTQTVQNEPLTPLLPIGTTAYGYNPQKNRLLTAGAFSFTYDNEGQLFTGYSATYTFDYEHRLKTIGSTIQFSYDGVGNRVQAVRNSVTTRYIYDTGGNLLAEADGNNNITKYYIHGMGLMAMVTPTNDVYTYHFNAVGSTIAMTDSSQNMVNKYSHDPFGNVVNQVEAIAQQFKFVGQHGVMTEPNGFYYMRARYYDPSVGRFVSEDPIGFEGRDVNLMAYAGNNPILLIDPDGLSWAVFDRSDKSIYVYPGSEETQGPPQRFSAGNNTTNPTGDPLTPESHGPAPNGSFTTGNYVSKGNDSNSSFGIGFIPINLPAGPNGQRTGVGIHSGQANQGGPEHKTWGCIRTTDAAMRAMQNDPLTNIYIQK